ncbi:MAG: ATP-binding protein [bacterium]
MKIKTKLTILFLLLSLVPFLVGGIMSFYNGRKALRDGIGRKLLESARNAMDKIDQNINNEIHDIEHWINNPTMNEVLTGDNNKNALSLLSSIMQAHPGYSHIDCINIKGEIVASSKVELLSKKIGIDMELEKALTGQISVSELHKDDLHKEAVISFYLPVSSDSNRDKVIGVLAAHLKLKEIHDAVNEIKIGEKKYSVSEHIMLIDKNGLVIYAPPIAAERGHVFSLNLLETGMQSAKLAIDGQEGYLTEINEHDKNALIGYAHSKGYKDFPGLGWSVLVMQSPDLAFKPIITLRNEIVLLGIFISIGIIFLSLFISNRISASLKSLVLSSTMIADGDLSQRVELTSNDEIGELIKSFNKMAEALEKSRRQLQDYADNLENKVKERTHELEKAYKDLKDTQLQLIQSGKLAAIGQLAAGVSHELNNPLGGIMGYSQLILEKMKIKDGCKNLALEDSQSIFTYAGYIEKESKKCKDIVANLLEFSRKSKDTEFDYLDINRVLEDTLLFTKNQLEINKVKIDKKLAQDIPNILGNAHQIQQVLTNLIVNAQQAMKQGGTLTITTKLLSKSVEISFADTGEGISEENMGKLFTPFFTTKEIGKGTGLGLSVSYGIIKNHKGEIKVESKVGKGSIFYVIFPITSIIG